MRSEVDAVNIIDKLAEQGIDRERLERVMKPKAENWGHLVYAFEVVTVLGTVLDAMQEEVRWPDVADELYDALQDAADDNSNWLERTYREIEVAYSRASVDALSKIFKHLRDLDQRGRDEVTRDGCRRAMAIVERLRSATAAGS
jgi:translation initiation factor 2 alpha subunit (eIF-2alpha)